MGLLRPAARILDAWGALILGVALVLAVMMLLAMPGPWREVVGAPPVAAPAEAVRDVVVFVRGGAEGEGCTAAVWLHVEHEQPVLTAVVVPVQLQVAVPGAGFDRLCRVVRLYGPGPAATALGEALGVSFAGSVALSDEGLSAAVPTMFPGGDTLAERRQRRVALRVWAGRGDATGVFRRQTESLAEALPRVPFESLSVVAVANYALGSELAESDLDLQQATALAERARDLRAHDVAVRALPVVREVRDEGVFWRPRPAEVERLVAALDLGLWPPRTDGGVETATRPGGVIVALPAAMDVALAGRFMTGLRDAVAGSAGPSIEVTTLRYGPSALEASFTATVAAARPLAVVLVGAPERAGEEAEAETARAQTIDCAAVLRALYQPSVLVVPVVDSGVGEELRPPDELEETGLPLVVAAVPGDGSGDAASAASTTSSTPGPTESPSPASPPASPLPPPTSPEEPSTSPAIGSGAVLDSRPAWEQTGRLAAAAAVRACWPVVLAPSLPGTRRGVTFAERRTAGLTVVEAEGAAATRAWLAACGYVVEADGGEWAPEAGVVHVVHHPGLRRLAAAVAGDLGVATALIAEDEDAPAPLTVVP